MPRILRVEDNEMSRDMLSRRLERRGFGPATVHRNIYTAADTVKSLQRALRGRNYYAGEPTGNLDQADGATVQALGVTTAGNNAK